MSEAASATHAGGVLFRRGGNEPEYLLITSSRGGEWVLPKGHIEPGESAEQAAAREVMEETAHRAKIVGSLGVQEYDKDDEHVTAIFYLMEVTDSVAPVENRTIAWLPYAAARDQLSFADAREVLDWARQHLEEPSIEHG